MSISKKGRRKLIVGDRLFLWNLDYQYGCHWREYELPAIRILSDDKAFEVFYQIRQLRTGESVLEIVRGVGSVPDAVYPRLTVHIPLEEDEEPTPGLVRRIIDCCLDPPIVGRRPASRSAPCPTMRCWPISCSDRWMPASSVPWSCPVRRSRTRAWKPCVHFKVCVGYISCGRGSPTRDCRT